MESLTKISSEVSRGKFPTTVIWHLKGWGRNEDFQELKSNASCVLNVGTENERGPRAQLRFYFGEYTEPNKKSGSYPEIIQYVHCLSLKVDQLRNAENKIFQYDFKVVAVDDKLDEINYANAIQISKSFPIHANEEIPRLILKNEFILLQQRVVKRGQYCVGERPLTPSRPADLRLKICVTPIFILDVMRSDVGAGPVGLALLCQAMRSMLTTEDNYADLKLELKDGLVISAHKFMLAARSPVLRQMIEKEVEEGNVGGSRIKLTTVDSKLMMLIIHWIYTGELVDYTSFDCCLEELVEAAVEFELTSLLKQLDKKLVTICNEENMLRLFELAKRNGMVVAADDICKFIKRYIGSDC